MSFNLSSSPHVRSPRSSRDIMMDVCIALIPATAFGVYRFGFYSLLILLVSIGFAVLSEYMYQSLTEQPVRIGDFSAVLTGLLLGLNMPPAVPLWIPALGSMFAVIVVKQFFGGLGQNFMNPALGGRCFLLISFTSLMSDFTCDVVSGATPLADMAAGGRADVAAMFVGLTGGTIGEVSAIALLIGGIYLLVKKVITWEIPVCYLGAFALFIFFFGEQSGNLGYVMAHLCGGGLMLGAWFMATDYVTSPITSRGKIVFGIFLGILTGIFRTFGVSAEGVSYAIIIGNLLVPLIEKVTMPVAFGYEGVKEKAPKAEKSTEAAAEAPAAAAEPISLKLYHAALKLCVITLIAGLALGTVFQMTKGPIEQAAIAAQAEAFKAVCPAADKFENAEDLMAGADAVNGKYGNTVVDGIYNGLDASGNLAGYIVNVTNKDGFGGEISACIGVDLDGAVTGIEFLAINETAGLGMNAQEESFRAQYNGVVVDEFTVTKNGKSADNEIEAISGATITSKAVTCAVNTAIHAVSAN